MVKKQQRIFSWRGLTFLFAAMIFSGIFGNRCASAQSEKVLSFADTQGIKSTFDQSPTRTLKIVSQAHGENALSLDGVTITNDKSHYFGVMIPLGRTWDFTKTRLEFNARSTQAENTAAFYVRGYNQGESKAAMSFSSWDNTLKDKWSTFGFQQGHSSLPAEASVTEGRKPTKIDRLEIIIGSKISNVPINIQMSNLRTAPLVVGIADLTAPKELMRTVPIIENGKAVATILHPDDAAGKTAAEKIANAMQQKTGVQLNMRAGTAADREFDENVILLGNVFNNPAMLLLYGRQFTPVDAICPSSGGYLTQTIHDPFGNGHSAIIIGASDGVGLNAAANAFIERIDKSTFTASNFSFSRFFDAKYGEDFLNRQSWLKQKPSSTIIQDGLKEGQTILDTGRHSSIAQQLKQTGERYQLSGNSDYAKLFVALWDLYAKSAVADPSKFGGPWGFDSDFPSYEVICSWDNIEEDPALTDADRLKVTKAMARWLGEAVIPKASVTLGNVAFNHQTFPASGAWRAGLYFAQSYPESPEGKTWLAQGDKVFRNQQNHFKSHEDCNTYQWITYRHMVLYGLARPDFTVFDNGNAARIADYGFGTMNNLGLQVPYGDTGVWNATYGESSPLGMIAFATGNKTARWLATTKQEIYKPTYLYSFQKSEDVPIPSGFNGVKVLPLEPAFVNTFPVEPRPQNNQLFDKISFRKSFDANAPYILLDGLNNGGHGHRDGNSIEQLTQFDRVWLADNDYFKSQAKYHNTLLVSRDGESTELPAYVGLLGHGETDRYGYSHTQLAHYSDSNWDRYVIWLKNEDAFVVLDKVTAQKAGEFQMRLLWHGMGDAQVDQDGMLLQQKGPSMRFQVAGGPDFKLTNDDELGKNWNSYKYADPIVRSFQSTARVKLKQGEHYLFATVIHGKSDGVAGAWKVNFLKGYTGIQIANGRETLNVQLGENGDQSNIKLQNVPGITTFAESQNNSPSKSTFMANAQLANTAIAPPLKNTSTKYQAAAFHSEWELNLQPDEALLTGNLGQPGAVKTPAKLSSIPVPQPNGNVLISSSNQLDDLLKNSPVMFEPNDDVALIIDLHEPQSLSKIRWKEYWAKTSSKGTAYLLDNATVEISNDNFAKDVRHIADIKGGEHPDWGEPVLYEADAKGQTARYVRLKLTPQSNSAIYLASVSVTGTLKNQETTQVAAQFSKLITARLQKDQEKVLLGTTREGTLLVTSLDGKEMWRKNFPTPLNDVAVGNLDNNGVAKIAIARQDGKVQVLDYKGDELWNQQLKFYRVAPYANLIWMQDLDGDGNDEIIVGANNWRFYTFDSSGKELWQFEVVHPSRSGAIADLDGDGKKEVIAGTHYYTASTLNSSGERLWTQRFKSPICYSIATGNFDGDKTRGVVFGGGDGSLYYTDFRGTLRKELNTGDEVKHVATADLDGNGIDDIFTTSDNGYLYCLDAKGNTRWLRHLGDAATALLAATVGDKKVVTVGTKSGDLIAFDAQGNAIRHSKFPAAIVQIADDQEGKIFIATADGQLSAIK